MIAKSVGWTTGGSPGHPDAVDSEINNLARIRFSSKSIDIKKIVPESIVAARIRRKDCKGSAAVSVVSSWRLAPTRCGT